MLENNYHDNLNIYLTKTYRKYVNLLPTGSEERGALGVVSILVAILPFCQDMQRIVLYLHKH